MPFENVISCYKEKCSLCSEFRILELVLLKREANIKMTELLPMKVFPISTEKEFSYDGIQILS